MKKKNLKPASKKNIRLANEKKFFTAADEKSLGSSNAFDATENPLKDSERELSDEELDDLIGDQD
ncbi:MAG: hypothetical protein JST75_17470 [Bacteroidetes bacterium]|nr:hypothetical protein [Bacteroidota bacterium]